LKALFEKSSESEIDNFSELASGILNEAKRNYTENADFDPKLQGTNEFDLVSRINFEILPSFKNQIRFIKRNTHDSLNFKIAELEAKPV
jgi:BMFP domain-containing protein YqiC